jgi:hypothetical protein
MKNEKDVKGPNSPQPAPTAPTEMMQGFSHRWPRSEDAFVTEQEC